MITSEYNIQFSDADCILFWAFILVIYHIGNIFFNKI